jgi:periplasmic protein TonB
VQTERHEVRRLNQGAGLPRPQGGLAHKQDVRLLIALSLLLVALAVVLVKDRDFWFGSDEVSESVAVPSQSISKTSSAVPVKTSQAPVAQAPTAKNHVAPKTSTGIAKDSSHTDAVASVPPVVATKRVVLPPLDVEVVAGDTHRTVHPGSNVAKVEIPGDSNRGPAVTTSAANLPTNAAEHERLSSGIVPELRQTIDTTYPLLGQHSKVQGSVVLQAVVGIDGVIENLRVLSGPSILAAAAQQAVRQWRFKPYLENGQPVETKTKITVNFTIRISDNAKNS